MTTKDVLSFRFIQSSDFKVESYTEQIKLMIEKECLR